jgi:aldose 1-epimerase
VRITAEPSSDPTWYDHHHRVRVRFAETDAMGIVHHSRYLPLLEEARVAYLRHIGHPYQSIRDDGVEMAVLEVFVQYRLPLRFDEVVDIHLAVSAVERATFQMAYLLTVDGEIRATAVTAHGCITPTGRPTRLPGWFAELRPGSRASAAPLELRNDRLAVTVVPGEGGRVAQVLADGVPLLIGPGEGLPDPTDPLAWGLYPMVPWCGRIRRGQFTFDGVEHQLPINFETHSIHGIGCRSAWTVTEHTAQCVRLELAMPADARWPFGGIARQTITIDGALLRLELSATALDHAMPASLGWHPWFRKPSAIDFRPSAMYRRDDEWITLDDLVAVPDAPFDDCFVNGDPVRLTIAGPDASVDLVLTSDCTEWVVFDMRTHGTCIEPQTAPPDSFTTRPNRLDPGDTLSAWYEIAIVD